MNYEQKARNQQEQFIVKKENGTTYVLYRNGYRRIFKKVIEMRRLEVPPKCYSTIRSFVESSNKDKYTWNTGIATNNKIQFIKMYKWILVVDADGIKLLRYKDNTTVLYIPSRGTNIIDVCRHELSTDGLSPLSTVITSDVPAAREIYLYEVMNKISEYIDW
ncbi:MAG: hypothetical protein QXI07_11635 [Pyrobaculum sp.]